MLSKYLLDFIVPDNFTNDQYHSLLRLLIHSQLHGHIAQKLENTDNYPTKFQRHLSAINTFSNAQHVQTIRACNIISVDLEDLTAPVLLLKGAAYIAAKKSNARGRLISDIDILVEKQYLSNVETLLLKNGWVVKELDDFDEKYYREWSHELPPYTHLETGVTLDVHHNLLPGSSGKTINIQDIIETKRNTEFKLHVPNDGYLILHSAIHLLLNDDIQKGLRDCVDLHYLITDYVKEESIETLQGVFRNANCEKEFFVLLNLLTKLFKSEADLYAKKTLELNNKKAYESISNDLEKAVFPASQYLYDSTNSFARFKVYIRGHLSKMPLTVFVRHIMFKAYRTLVKKLFGDYIFKKDHSQNR